MSWLSKYCLLALSRIVLHSRPTCHRFIVCNNGTRFKGTTLVYLDEAGCNLNKGRRRGRNVTGQRVTVRSYPSSGAIRHPTSAHPLRHHLQGPHLPTTKGCWYNSYHHSPLFSTLFSAWGGRYMIVTHIRRYPSRGLQRLDKTFSMILSMPHCKGRYPMWCGWDHVAQHKGSSASIECINV